MLQASTHQVWPRRWIGETHVEATDGSWKSDRHADQRRALLTPKRVRSLKLPSGAELAGKRRTVIHPADCTKSGSLSKSVTPTLNACTDTDTEFDATDPEMPELTTMVMPDAQSARAALARLHAKLNPSCKSALNSNGRSVSEDQPTIFNDGGQGHKRRVQQRRESTQRP